MSDVYISDSDEILSPDEEVIHEQNKIIERLQEQLKEANEVIKDYDGFTAELTTDGKYAFKIANNAHLYLEKWDVK